MEFYKNMVMHELTQQFTFTNYELVSIEEKETENTHLYTAVDFAGNPNEVRVTYDKKGYLLTEFVLEEKKQGMQEFLTLRIYETYVESKPDRAEQ
jgi:hypothetical protein